MKRSRREQTPSEPLKIELAALELVYNENMRILEAVEARGEKAPRSFLNLIAEQKQRIAYLRSLLQHAHDFPVPPQPTLP